MGQCATTCCSNDSTAEKKAKQKYMGSLKSRPQTKLASQSMTTSNYNTYLDEKTMELLSHLNPDDLPPIEKHESMQDFVIPKVVPNASKSASNESIGLEALEKAVTMSRVKKLTEIIDADELQQIIKEQYSYEDDDGLLDEDDQSSLSENEKLEIIQRKASSVQNKSLLSVKNPSLYRPKTTSDWDEQRIDSLTSDMEKQLITLKNRESQTKLKSNKNYKIVVDDISSSIDMEDAHLFRNQSADKWDYDDMETTKEEMRKEMMSLMLDHQETVSSST